MDYELEPERPTDNPPAVDDSSTEHHESLLRAEAARASRTNRVLGSFVVAGFAAATIVGVVTWQNVSPSHDDGPVPVEEAAAGGSLPSSEESSTANSDGDQRSTGATSPDSDGSDSDGRAPVRSSDSRNDHVTPLTADQYAPPNAWSGDQFVTPGQYPAENEDTARDDAGDSAANGADSDTGSGNSAENTTGESDNGGSSPERPSLTDLLPSIPGMPSLPGNDGSDSDDTPEDTGAPESTDPSEPVESTNPAEPTEPTEPSESAAPSASDNPGRPTGERTPGDNGTTGTPDSPNDPDDAVTDTTGPTP
ncbi:MAG: hypothetical protein ACI38U_00965 [Corynebacterium sp.]|uniref:hypothetical protein n=1 Tax=unclassified Corynebacterium TaxID=2624378 RepID=UPI00095F3D14|nr:hypothetical protein [Corynebacterium sp. CNJ-954]OLT55613.1 hypothetical protein BJF89_15145 [Corynebacterium sp. CNJ-954]